MKYNFYKNLKDELDQYVNGVNAENNRYQQKVLDLKNSKTILDDYTQQLNKFLNNSDVSTSTKLKINELLLLFVGFVVTNDVLGSHDKLGNLKVAASGLNKLAQSEIDTEISRRRRIREEEEARERRRRRDEEDSARRMSSYSSYSSSSYSSSDYGSSSSSSFDSGSSFGGGDSGGAGSSGSW